MSLRNFGGVPREVYIVGDIWNLFFWGWFLKLGIFLKLIGFSQLGRFWWGGGVIGVVDGVVEVGWNEDGEVGEFGQKVI